MDSFELDIKSVEDYLNEICYDNFHGYSPSKFALEFISFIKLVNGAEGESHKSPVVHYKMLDNINTSDADTINMCHRGMAKALSVDAQIITPNGNVSMGDIQVGDKVYTRNGTVTTVTHKSEIFNKPMYRMELEDGRTLDVSEDHLNIVLKRLTGKRTIGGFKEHVLTTAELLNKGVTYTRKMSDRNPKGYESKWFIPTAGLVEHDVKEIPLDPYTVGAILGDGSINKSTGFSRFHTHEDDLSCFLENLEGACPESVRTDKRRDSTKRFSLKGIGNTVKSFIGTENVYGKRVPQDILWSSSAHRLACLQGLMDTDGTVHDGSSSFCTVSEGLANDVLYLARSLGFEAKIRKGVGYSRVYIYADICPFRLPRKVARWKANKKGMVAIKSISAIPNIESQCIAVADSSHSFLAESFFVTHNTTLLGEYLFLYLAVFGEIPEFGSISLAIYVSDSIDNGVKNMRKNLEFRRDNSDFLLKVLPKVRFTDTRWEFTNIDGRKFIVKGYGAKTGVRGAKEMGIRPQLAVLDDLLSDEDARSPTVISSIEDTVYKAIDYALDPERRKIIWSGTPFNASDPLYKAVESGAWKVNVYPVCEQFPCAKEDFRGSWEERFSYEYVMRQYTKAKLLGKIDTFNQELMLRIMSEEDRLIQDGDITWYERTPVLQHKERYNFYITTDFATSEKTSADFSVISVWAYTKNEDWLWVDGICAKQDMNDNLNDLFRLVQMYNPLSVGVEVSGQQGGFVSLIQREMGYKDTWFDLATDNNSNSPGIRPNTNKLQRFNTAVPLFKRHKIKFPIELKNTAPMLQCMDELSLVSRKGFKSKHDDFSDTISMLTVMRPWAPSYEIEMVQDDSGIWISQEITDEYDSGAMSSYVV